MNDMTMTSNEHFRRREKDMASVLENKTLKIMKDMDESSQLFKISMHESMKKEGKDEESGIKELRIECDKRSTEVMELKSKLVQKKLENETDINKLYDQWKKKIKNKNIEYNKVIDKAFQSSKYIVPSTTIYKASGLNSFINVIVIYADVS